MCQVNTRCHLPERLSLPMASDLALSTQPEDTPGAFIGAALTLKPHTNKCRTWPSSLRLSREALPWQRTGAFLLCQVHGLLAWKPHKAFLFVDDRCSSFVPLQHPFRGKRCNSRIAWFGAVGRSTSLTTPFSSCPLNWPRSNPCWEADVCLARHWSRAPCQNWVAVLRSCWCCFTSSIDRHLAQDTIEVQDLMCDCLHV